MTTDVIDKENISETQKTSFIIRNGEEKDLDEFFEVYWISSLEHVQYNEKFDALKPKEQCKEFIINRQKEFLKDKNQFFFVAENNNRIIGVITGRVGQRDDPIVYIVENMGFIDELSVLPEYRKSGIGKKLIERVLKEFKELGVEYVGLGVAYSNATAMKFYKSYGFNPEGIWMIKNMKETVV